MSSRRELERLLRATFAAPPAPDSRPFEALQPPAPALEAIEGYVAASSPSEVQRIADCVLDVSAYVSRHATAEVTAKDPPYGRLSAWLICLEPLVLAECLSLAEVHAQLWPTVLRRSLVPNETGGPPLHREAIAAVKRMLRETWRRSAALRPDAFTEPLQPLEQLVLDDFAAASVGSPGASLDRAAGNLEDVLIALGKIQPKAFFAAIAQAIASKSAQRTPMIRLLSAFLRIQGQLAHFTIDARIHEQLLLCVLLDADVVVVAGALYALTMLLCRVPGRLVSSLAALFACVARSAGLVLEPGLAVAQATIDGLTTAPMLSPRLARGISVREGVAYVPSPSRPPLDEPPLPPRPLHEFVTYLYGLFPNNLVAFVRDPVGVLDAAAWTPPWSVGEGEAAYGPLELDELLRRLDPILGQLTIHSYLLTHTAENEIADPERWKRAETSTIVHECEGRMATAAAIRAQSPYELGEPTWPVEGSPVEFQEPLIVAQPTADLIAAHAQLKQTTAGVAAGADVSAPALERQVALLRAELGFELHLKQQHHQLMGALHREQVLRSGIEATRQTLHNEIRYHRKAAHSADVALKQERDESLKRKMMHASWNTEQKTKITSLREEKRAWVDESARMKTRIEELTVMNAGQALELEAAGHRLFDLEATIADQRPRIARVAELEARIDKLTRFMLAWDEDIDRQRALHEQSSALISEWAKAEQRAKDDAEHMDELRKTVDDREATIERLERDLADARRQRDADSRWRAPNGIDAAPSTRRELEALKSEFAALRQRNLVLEDRLAAARYTPGPIP